MIIIVENFISNWLKDILVVFIVISFLEIILPKGKMKKFVNFIIGLLIIFVIISPFTDLESLQFNIDLQGDEFMDRSDAQGIINEQEARVKEVFTNSINEEVKKLVENNTDYVVVDVNTNAKEEQDTISIEEVSLTIKQDTHNNRGEIAIDQIQIQEPKQPPKYEEKHDDIEKLITDYLGVERNIVYISEID